jgi:hypothetical protein
MPSLKDLIEQGGGGRGMPTFEKLDVEDDNLAILRTGAEFLRGIYQQLLTTYGGFQQFGFQRAAEPTMKEAEFQGELRTHMLEAAQHVQALYDRVVEIIHEREKREEAEDFAGPSGKEEGGYK